MHPLHDLADLSLLNRFVRVYVADEKHGLPYLNAIDLLSLFAVGLPARQRFLSRTSDVDLKKLVIRRNWFLMTCSDTIGRVSHVPKRLDGWVATHDLIRIRPKPGLVGYLFAWCMTGAARAQVLAHTHGGQIDHVTDGAGREDACAHAAGRGSTEAGRRCAQGAWGAGARAGAIGTPLVKACAQ